MKKTYCLNPVVNDLLSERNITQRKFCQQIGISLSSFSGILAKDRSIGANTRQKILSGLQDIGIACKFFDIFAVIEE